MYEKIRRNCDIPLDVPIHFLWRHLPKTLYLKIFRDSIYRTKEPLYRFFRLIVQKTCYKKTSLYDFFCPKNHDSKRNNGPLCTFWAGIWTVPNLLHSEMRFEWVNYSEKQARFSEIEMKINCIS